MSISIPNSGVKEAAKRRLRKSSYPSVKKVRCEVHGGVLVLSGRVSSFFEKQMAQETIAGLEGIDKVVNCVEVP